MTNVKTVSEKLRNEYAASLVSLSLDFLLNKPVQDLFSVSFLANQISLSLQTLSEGEETKEWIAEQVKVLRAQVPKGTPGDYLPRTIQAPLRDLLSHRMELHQQLIRQLLES